MAFAITANLTHPLIPRLRQGTLVGFASRGYVTVIASLREPLGSWQSHDISTSSPDLRSKAMGIYRLF